MKTNFTKLILLVAVAFCSATGFAQSPWTSGSTTVSLVGTTMTVSGTGAMADYTNSNQRGWNGDAATVTTLIIEEGVTTVGMRAFYNFTSLTSVSLPSTLSAINEYGFGNTSSLTTITLPAALTSIGNNGFKSSGVTEIKCLGTGAITTGTDAFDGVTATVLYPGSGAAPAWISSAGLTAIPTGPWTAGGVTVTITGTTLTVSGSGDLTVLGSWWAPYYQAKITEVVVGSGITGLASYAFYGFASLTDVSLPAGLTSIGDNVFRNNTSLTDVTFPASLASIGAGAFNNTRLTNVTFPASLNSIGSIAFSGVSTLEEISFTGNTPPATIATDAFSGISSTAKVTVPAGSESAYSSSLPSGLDVKAGYWVETKANPASAGKTEVVIGGSSRGAKAFTSEDSVVVVATATGEGSAFENWTIDGKVVSTSPSYKLEVSSVTITANFKKAPVTFTPKEAYYTGMPKSVQVVVNDASLGEITAVYYVYQGIKDSKPSTTPPTETGTYQILIDFAPSATYPTGGIRYSLGNFSIVNAPDPAPIPRAIYLSATPGITTSPAAGRIYNASGQDFVLIARTSSTTPGLVPLVISEPAIDASTIKYEKNPDGSYTITISALRHDVRLSLDFVAANATVDATKVWASGGQLYIATVQAGEAQIYNLVGRQVKTLSLAAGETLAETLPTGVYIVSLNGRSYKVLIGK
jgi:hypothetical protein